MQTAYNYKQFLISYHCEIVLYCIIVSLLMKWILLWCSQQMLSLLL